MSYVVTGLSPEPFRPLFELSDEALAAQGVLRRTVDANPGFPCRVSLDDAAVGDTVLLLNYEHQSADTPFRARHAIYVSQGAREAVRTVDEAPAAIRRRAFISLRAFDEAGMLVDAEVAPGAELDPVIARLLARPDAAYLHAHYAAMGCFAARIDRT